MTGCDAGVLCCDVRLCNKQVLLKINCTALFSPVASSLSCNVLQQLLLRPSHTCHAHHRRRTLAYLYRCGLPHAMLPQQNHIVTTREQHLREVASLEHLKNTFIGFRSSRRYVYSQLSAMVIAQTRCPHLWHCDVAIPVHHHPIAPLFPSLKGACLEVHKVISD